MSFDDDELESEIEGNAMDYAESRGWWQVKIKRTSKRGFPDRFLARKPDGVLLIEFKRDGKEPTVQQLKRHRELREHGVRVEVCDNLEDAKRILK